MGVPGRLFGLPVPWLRHRPALQASRQHLDGLGERICLHLEPVHAFLHRGRAGRTACFRWCVHDQRCCPRAEGGGQGLRSQAVMPRGMPTASPSLFGTHDLSVTDAALPPLAGGGNAGDR